jgi:pimeloyl-ACP methyl ester carboxylesterase
MKARRIVLTAIIATIGIAILGLVVALLVLSPGRPAAVVDGNGEPVPGSISEKIFVDINGVEQGMFIVGRDPGNPVLLFVHGGLPEYFLDERYPTGLEELFTVAWWEQRGSGLSHRDDISKESITSEQLISDTIAATNYLRQRFGQERIYLMAHSGGTFFAIQAAARHPALYAAYIGVAQYANQIQSEKLAYDYMLDEYRKARNARMVEALEAAPVTLKGGAPSGYLAVRDAAMHGLGIGTTHDMRSVASGIFFPSLTFRGYTIPEKIRLWRAKIRNGVHVVWSRSLFVDMSELVPSLEIPAYFLEGVFDYTCSYDLAKDYFRRLEAPVKGFYSFTSSAHSPHFEEPERVRRIMREDVLSEANSLADDLSDCCADSHPAQEESGLSAFAGRRSGDDSFRR